MIDSRLVDGIDTFERRENLFIDVGDGLPNAFAEITALVAVSQFESLVFASACTAGDGGTANGAVLEGHIGLDGGVATRV